MKKHLGAVFYTSLLILNGCASTIARKPSDQPQTTATVTGSAGDTAYGMMLASVFGPVYNSQYAAMTINHVSAAQLMPMPIQSDSPTGPQENYNYASFRGMAQPNHAEARVFAAFGAMQAPVNTISIYTGYAPCETCGALFSDFARTHARIARDLYYTTQWPQMTDGEVYSSLTMVQNAGWSIGRICLASPDTCWTFQRAARNCFIQTIPTLCAHALNRVSCITGAINGWMGGALRSANGWNTAAETLGPIDHQANVEGIDRCIGEIIPQNYPVGPPLQ